MTNPVGLGIVGDGERAGEKYPYPYLLSENIPPPPCVYYENAETERGGRMDSWKKKLLWGLWGTALVLSVAALLLSPPTPTETAGDAAPSRTTAAEAAQTSAARPVKGYLALTFDDGPWPETTERLLDGLAQRGAKATFFLIGNQIEGQESTIRRMSDEGHQIGLHTWEHIQLKGLTAGDIGTQLDRTRGAIQDIIGPEKLMLRPPYGFVDETLKACVNTPIICWSVDTEDWKDKTVSRIVETAAEGAEDGAIILMHDIFDTSVTAALEIVDRLMVEGYYFVTVEQLFALHGVTPEKGQVVLSIEGESP